MEKIAIWGMFGLMGINVGLLYYNLRLSVKNTLITQEFKDAFNRLMDALLDDQKREIELHDSIADLLGTLGEKMQEIFDFINGTFNVSKKN